MTWRPLTGWLLVKPIETEEKFPGGLIVIPEAVRDRTAAWQYEVVSQGPLLEPEEDEEPFTPSQFQVGDWILSRSRSAFLVEEEGIILLAESDCWGRF